MLWQGFGRWGSLAGAPGAGGSPWTPDVLGSDIEAWWDPEVGIGFAGAPNVNTWTDKIKSHILTSSGSSPLGLNTTQNGHYVLDVETVANARMLAPYSCTSSAFMCCGMMRYKNAGDAYGRYLSFGNGTNANDFAFNDVWQMSRDNLTANIGATRNGGIGGGAPGYLTYYTFMVVFDGTTGYFYIDDVEMPTAAAKSGAFAITGLGLCTSYDSSLGSGDVGRANFGDIITMHRAPTTTERQKFFGWLAHKWGLTSRLDAGHPYKTSPPTV